MYDLEPILKVYRNIAIVCTSFQLNLQSCSQISLAHFISLFSFKSVVFGAVRAHVLYGSVSVYLVVNVRRKFDLKKCNWTLTIVESIYYLAKVFLFEITGKI